MSFNKIIIVGNLGQDVTLKYTPAGMAVANFSVATTEGKKNKDGDWDNITTWFKCTAWGKAAENCNKFLSKGSNVYLEGRLSEEKWQDKEGNERTSLVVNVSDVQFLEKREQTSNESDSKSSSKVKASKQDEDEDDDKDIPF